LGHPIYVYVMSTCFTRAALEVEKKKIGRKERKKEARPHSRRRFLFDSAARIEAKRTLRLGLADVNNSA
jgi:hypothetical protein